MKWDYCLVRCIDEEPFVSESMWEKGDEGWELVSAYRHEEGSLTMIYKRPDAALGEEKS